MSQLIVQLNRFKRPIHKSVLGGIDETEKIERKHPTSNDSMKLGLFVPTLLQLLAGSQNDEKTEFHPSLGN